MTIIENFVLGFFFWIFVFFCVGFCLMQAWLRDFKKEGKRMCEYKILEQFRPKKAMLVEASCGRLSITVGWIPRICPECGEPVTIACEGTDSKTLEEYFMRD